MTEKTVTTTRLMPDVREHLRELAERHGTSVNAEVNRLGRESMNKEKEQEEPKQ